MRIITSLLVVLALGAGCRTQTPHGDAPPVVRPITRDILTEMFETSPWDLSRPMVWGYFFISRSRASLQGARAHLESLGYEFVSLHEFEGGTGKPTLTLQMRRVESHTVDSLLERNELLYGVASQFRLDSYDGMDVGPVELERDLNLRGSAGRAVQQTD